MLKRMSMANVRKEIATTNRPVLLVCEKEGRVRTHKFTRAARSDARNLTALMFSCQACKHERMYGAEG